MNEIYQAIREARQGKGLSQAALSELVGLPQSHLSKIESGKVDIKLSSLVQIARALDLELELVPRRALPAVQSVLRSVPGFPRDRGAPAQAEIAKAMRSLDHIAGLSPLPAETHQALAQLSDSLKGLRNVQIDTGGFVRLKNIAAHLQELSRSFPKLETGGFDAWHKQLENLSKATRHWRNQQVHAEPELSASRPAYRLEDEDE